MPFHFTEEDFKRYVTVDEHGGRHIWHELQDRLKHEFRSSFSSTPYIARGDRLRTLWFAPIGTPRRKWANQAQFFLIRSIEEKQLSYGLMIECPTSSEVAEYGLDQDRDGVRLVKLLHEDYFNQLLNDLVRNQDFNLKVNVWDKDTHSPSNAAELLSVLESLPPEQGWGTHIQRVLSDSEAIASGENIADRIMDVYRATRPLFEAVVPDSVRDYLAHPIASLPRNEELEESANHVNRLTVISAHFAAHGLHFTPHQLATFYTALKTKGFVILTGISGTGKTKLAQYFAELLGSKDQFHFAAVRPDWRDSKSLLGYFNPLLGQEGQFQSTEFLGFILEATEQYLGSGNSKREDLLALVEKLVEFDSPLTRADLPKEARELVQRQPGIQKISRETFAKILDLAAAADRFDLSRVTQTFLLRLHEVSPYADEPRKQYHFRMGIPGSRQLSDPMSKGEKVAFVYYSPDRSLWAAGTFDRMERRKSGASPYIPYFVLLDEMNLAKVEYYFADFLSVLESGRDDDGFTKEAIRFQYPEGIDGPPPKLRLPPNLYFIGTVNVDETTYMFSPKVLDRAFTLELSTVEFPRYINSTTEGEFVLSPDEQQRLLDDFTRSGKFATIGEREKEQIKAFAKQPDGEYTTYAEHLTTLNALLQPHDLHFGYRVFDEIMMFLANAEDSPVSGGFGPDSRNAAFDAAVLMKVLPKFHGTRGKLRLPLLNVFAWAMTPGAGHDLREQVEGLEKEISGSEEKEKARLNLIEMLRENPGEARMEGKTFAYPRTALKALRMLHDVHTTGFASFA